MRKTARLTLGVTLAAALTLGAAGAALAAPAVLVEPKARGNANCVAQFTSALGPIGAAGMVISGGAHDLQPFGRNVVVVQAHSPGGLCVFDPNDFIALPPSSSSPSTDGLMGGT